MKKKRVQTEDSEMNIFSKIWGWITGKVYDFRVFLNQKFSKKSSPSKANNKKSQRNSLIFYIGFFTTVNLLFRRQYQFFFIGVPKIRFKDVSV